MLGGRQTTKNIIAEALALGILLFSICLPFAGAFSHGQSLSKLSLLSDIDLSQDNTKSFAIHSDPSQATTHTPNEYFIEKSTSELPLWNNLNGAGRPVIGDFQTLAFSFFHQLFPSSDSTLASIGIVFKLLLGAVGAYCLSRMLGVSRIASVAVGQAFGLAPHCLQFMELCNNYCFYPWLITAAIWGFSRPSPARIVLLGLLCGASAYNMHPETFVSGVGGAFLFAAFRSALLWKPAEFTRKLPLLVVSGLAASLLAFLVSAPLVLPFLEFIANGVSYKFGDTHLEFINLFSFLSNLLAPFSAGSNFVGLVLGACVLIGLVSSWRKGDRSISLAVLALLLFTTRPGPLESWLGQKPLSFLLPEYTSYLCILLVAIAGGIGLDELLNRDAAKSRMRNAWLLLPAVAGLGLALLLNNPALCERWSDLTSWGFDFNYVLKPTDIAIQIASIVLLLILAIINSERLRRWSGASAVLLVLLNYLPLLSGAGFELPASKPYWYHYPEIISILKAKQMPLSFRSTAAGDHLIQPNTNLIYGFDDFRCTAPLHPLRYSKFADACGIKSRNCNIYTSPYQLNRLYDLASVKLIVSDAPVHSADPDIRDRETGPGQACDYQGLPVKMRPGLRLDKASFQYFPKAQEIDGAATLAVHMSGRFSYYYQWLLLDDNSKPFWQSSWQASTIEQIGEAAKNHRYRVGLAASIPSRTHSRAIKIALRIRSGSSVDNPNWHDRTTILAQVQRQENSPGLANTGRIVKVADTADGFQLYENSGALPSAYLVHQIIETPSPEDSLNKLADKNLDLHDSAIVEEVDNKPILAEDQMHLLSKMNKGDPERSKSDNIAVSRSKNNGLQIVSFSSEKIEEPGFETGMAKASKSILPDVVRVLDKAPNQVSIMAKSRVPGFLVLTDTFYPGWTVYVDGKLDRIFPANYAFRAVYLPAGKHHILFSYAPQSFDWGLKLFYAGLAVSLVILLWQGITAITYGGKGAKTGSPGAAIANAQADKHENLSASQRAVAASQSASANE